ncbi:serine/threonine protein phosphatase [Candidatus Dependentiae bacterium]|nr:serine/threonine protein phosphatase [Candidatus Dependentiae bacterium]
MKRGPLVIFTIFSGMLLMSLPVIASDAGSALDFAFQEGRVKANQVFHWFDHYLKQPEFVFEKEMFTQQSAVYYKANYPFTYPEAIIPALDYLDLLTSFIKTYNDKGLPNGHHVQKTAIAAGAEVRFFGDLHGDIQALVRMLCKLMQDGFLTADLRLTNPNNYLVFLGDFIDYGRYGADTLAMMMFLRVLNPDQVLVCRGNHEDANVYMDSNYGFYAELQSRYGARSAAALKMRINEAFARLPLAIFVGIAGRPGAGFIQCCHGGLEVDAVNKRKIQDMLTAAASEQTALMNYGWGAFSNLQWGDFTGRPLTGGSASVSGRGTQFDIDGVKNYMPGLIRYVFRGHQDHTYACKHLVRGIKDPICLAAVVIPDKEALLAAIDNTWLSDKASTVDRLNEQEFVLGEFPDFIGPVFTFTNASSTRSNYDEGFGILSVAESWEHSQLRFYIARPEIFKVRAAVWDNKNIVHYIPSVALGGLLAAADQVLSQGPIAALLFPLTTFIDKNGQAIIGLRKIDDEEWITKSSQHKQIGEWVTKCMDHYKMPDGVVPGISREFWSSIISKRAGGGGDGTPTAEVSVSIDSDDEDAGEGGAGFEVASVDSITPPLGREYR